MTWLPTATVEENRAHPRPKPLLWSFFSTNDSPASPTPRLVNPLALHAKNTAHYIYGAPLPVDCAPMPCGNQRSEPYPYSVEPQEQQTSFGKNNRRDSRVPSLTHLVRLIPYIKILYKKRPLPLVLSLHFLYGEASPRTPLRTAPKPRSIVDSGERRTRSETGWFAVCHPGSSGSSSFHLLRPNSTLVESIKNYRDFHMDAAQ